MKAFRVAWSMALVAGLQGIAAPVGGTSEAVDKAYGPPVRVCPRQVFEACGQDLPQPVKEVRMHGGIPGLSKNAFMVGEGQGRVCGLIFIETRDQAIDLEAEYLTSKDGASEWKGNPEDILLRAGYVLKAWRRSDGSAFAWYRECRIAGALTRELMIVGGSPPAAAK